MNPIGAVANRAIPHVRGFKPRLPVRIVSNRAYLPVEDCFKPRLPMRILAFTSVLSGNNTFIKRGNFP